MKQSDFIREVSENLKALSVAFRYLEPVKHYREALPDEPGLNHNNTPITLKPIRIDKYQTSTYMQTGTYYKPISRLVMPRHNADENAKTVEII